MSVYDWATKWGLPAECILDLQHHCGITPPVKDPSKPLVGEAAVQQRSRIRASEQGRRLFRNNVGVMFREDGTPVRFGVANDSKQMNERLKSSDLIGITPVLITQEHVGKLFGRFTSFEIKKSDWVFNPNDSHVLGQQRWHELVTSLGGESRFITHEDQI